ncbi:MAG: hypothetical protein JWO63_3166 [Frankiales bacterium]|nr:hypothetical protein [Frankiales bacterium]
MLFAARVEGAVGMLSSALSEGEERLPVRRAAVSSEAAVVASRRDDAVQAAQRKPVLPIELSAAAKDRAAGR